MNVVVIVPNWNGAAIISECLESLASQSYKCTIVVVDNGSQDNSVELIEENFPSVILLKNPENLGFAGGVNTGIRYALQNNADAIALFNSDAVADNEWLSHLVKVLEVEPSCGIVTGKILKHDERLIDNTGECFSIWGIPFARSRDESAGSKKLRSSWIFGASGGSTLYRAKMLESIGLFDEDFFAYYEDADMNFRAQLAGWKAYFESKAIVYHSIGGTSGKIKGFTTYQTIKNLPWLIVKNIPLRFIPAVFPRFILFYSLIVGKALLSSRFPYALKALFVSLIYLPKKVLERQKIQKTKSVNNKYIKSILTYDLPPNATKLRRIFG